jgi:hypothetical protein
MKASERLVHLLETVALEAEHLAQTDQRLFAHAFDAGRAQALRHNIEESERTDAFVARFGRLQDTLGDKLLPELLACLGETLGPVIDNLDRAEKLGLMDSADQWLAIRKLRNRMVHEYVRDMQALANALNEAHAAVPVLQGFAKHLAAYIAQRTGD